MTTFHVADDLSLPICQAVIDYIFSKEASLSSETSDVLSAALSQAVKAAVDGNRSAGLQLLVTLDKSLTNKVRIIDSYVRVLTLIRSDPTTC